MEDSKLCMEVNIKLPTPKSVKTMKTEFRSTLGPVESAKFCSNFLQLNSFEEMFAHFWNSPTAHKCLVSPMPSISGKSQTVSEGMRKDGNNYFKSDRTEEALRLYNLCIVFAPHPALPLLDMCTSEARRPTFEDTYKTLSCGYANRSAVFLRLKEYERCLIDIDIAIQFGYPMHLKKKLLERKERCLKAQRESAVEEGRPSYISGMSYSSPVITSPNSYVPSFSSSLKIAHSPERGRHIVATRSLRPGDVLVVEKSSYCFLRLKSNWVEICSTCFLSTKDQPFPCPDCLMVFCSESCRDKGREGIHSKECKMLPFIQAFDSEVADIVNLCHLRVIIQTTFMELKDKWPVLQKEAKELPHKKLGFDENGIYKSNDYRIFYHMNAYSKRKKNVKLYDLCFYAFVYTKMLLESGGFFLDRLGNKICPNTEDYILTGAALLYHMGHVVKLFPVYDMKNTSKQCLGLSIFPAVGMLNHSCNPTAAHYNVGQSRIVRAIACIPAGSEVTITYIDAYDAIPLMIRKTMLNNLGINCSCQACEEDWPTEIELQSDLSFKCRCGKRIEEVSFVPVCTNCNISYANTLTNSKNLHVKKFWLAVEEVCQARLLFDDVVSRLFVKEKVVKLDLRKICNYIVALEKHVSLPSQYHCQARRVLIEYFSHEL